MDQLDIRASGGPATISITATAPVEIRAADEKAGYKRPTFEMVGYTGAPVTLSNFYTPVIIDLTGLKVERQEIPVFRDHDSMRIVGQTTKVEIDGQGVRLAGQVTGENDDAEEVVTQAKNGFKWQASVGATIVRREFLESGKTATVNGRSVSGPIVIAREALLKEISFVALGADSQTSASVAASNSPGLVLGDKSMSFEDWLKAKGFDPTTLSDSQKSALQLAFKAEQAPANPPAASTAPATPPTNPSVQATGSTAAHVKSLEEIVAEQRKERARVDEINAITAKAIDDRPLMLDTLEAMAKSAIEKGNSPLEFKLAVFEAQMQSPQGPAVHARQGLGAEKDASKIVEAALCLTGGLPNVEKQYDERTLDEANRRFRHGLGLRDVLSIVAREHGYSGHTSNDVEGLLRAAFALDVRASGGFSTLSLPGILSNSANKFLWVGFNSVEDSWRRICNRKSVRDFKQISTYALTGGFKFLKVGAGGEIKHGTVGEQTYNNQADTYGRMFAITRKDIINDDLGALTDVPRRLGRGAALALNETFWTEFLANVSTFFTSARGNYFEGSTTNLQSSSLKTAMERFRKQTDPDGNPLGVTPRLLLVPPELEVAADELMTSTAVNTGGSSTTEKVPNRNVWTSKFEVVMSTYLSNTSITNFSTTAWWLLADPMDLPIIEVAFLNGREQPVVESAQADFNTLGIQMRGYFDYGVAKQEYRAGVRSKGAA